MSRFNTLYHGPAGIAADNLEGVEGHVPASASVDPDELRVALINALRRVEQLEQERSR